MTSDHRSSPQCGSDHPPTNSNESLQYFMWLIAWDVCDTGRYLTDRRLWLGCDIQQRGGGWVAKLFCTVRNVATRATLKACVPVVTSPYMVRKEWTSQQSRNSPLSIIRSTYFAWSSHCTERPRCFAIGGRRSRTRPNGIRCATYCIRRSLQITQWNDIHSVQEQPVDFLYNIIVYIFVLYNRLSERVNVFEF